MKFTQADKEAIFKIYIGKINQYCDEFEDKSHFTPEEVVEIVLESVEECINDET